MRGFLNIKPHLMNMFLQERMETIWLSVDVFYVYVRIQMWLQVSLIIPCLIQKIFI